MRGISLPARRRMSGHFGDLDVYTSDPGDLEALRDGVPALAKIKVTRA
jgi:hypothetical protein